MQTLDPITKTSCVSQALCMERGMELTSDPLTWRDSVMFAGMPQYQLSAAEPTKLSVQQTDLIVLGGCNLNSPQFESGLKDCDRLSTSSMKSSMLTIYNIESDGSRLRGFGRTSPCTTTNTLSFNLQQREDVDHDELFHDYHVSSHMINGQEDVPTFVSSPLGISNHVFASGLQTPDEVEDLHQPCGALPYGHTFEGSYAIKIGSCVGSTDQSADESLAKTAIKTHALYPYLVSAHINCCQVGAKAADLKILEEARSRHQHLQRRNNSRSSPFTKPELVSIMAWYLGMLLDIKEKVEEPFFTEMEWCDGVLEKLKQLGPCTSPIPITGLGGPPNARGNEGSAFNTAETRHQGYESSSLDKGNDVVVEQWKQDTIVKQWLRSKHDRSEIYNLRGQCKKKRRQGKHPETARELLVEWFNGHGDWPYPSEEEKLKLAEETNLEARQINNWFINQRKRHWDSSTKEEIVHHGQQDLESRRQISDLEKFVKDRFYASMDVFNPSHNLAALGPLVPPKSSST